MKRFPNLLIAVLLIALLGGLSVAEARPLSEREARQVASRFFVSRGLDVQMQRQPVTASTARRAPSATPAYYVYNNTEAGMPRGFVIVSGDDRALPVLGYSDSGAYDPANVPPAMQEWLETMAAELGELGEDDGTSYAPHRALGGKIAPMVTSNWDQNEPYNLQLPNSQDGNRAVTGCVATAMAQIMYYHRCPAGSCTAIPEYTTETQSIYRPGLAATTFDWANMRDNYKDTDTGTPANAVAKLMLYCGQAVEMDYKNGVSSASSHDIPKVFQNYFGFARSIRIVQREQFTREAWEELLYAELKAKRPVVYSGATMANSGHAFVCDGYDNTTGLFHINWGWSGGSNGYYALSALTTKIQGTGGSSGTEGYIARQTMVVGIQPASQGIDPTTALTFSGLELYATSYNRTGSNADFNNVKVRGRFSNYTGSTRSVNTGWALYKGNTRVAVVSNGYTYNDLKPGWGGTTDYQFSFGANLSTGTYRLVPISRVSPSGAWEVCVGGDANYVEAQITSTRLTLTPYGANGKPSYKVNDVAFDGFRHAGKTVSVTANVTNNGTSLNDKIYLFADGVKTTMEVLDINPGSTGTVTFFYRPETTGTKTLTLTLNDDGTNPLATRTLTIEAMPAASLSMRHSATNMQSGAVSGRTLKGNSTTVTTTVTNNGAAYAEEVMAYLCRVTKKNDNGGYSGTIVQTVTKPLTLAAGSTGTITMTFDELITGEMYFINYYYFSSGEKKSASGVSTFTVAGGTTPVRGDVNGDRVVDVDDLNIIINIIVKKATLAQWPKADIDGSGNVDVDDLNTVINIMVGKA